ncbi:uncharacterized protein [Lepeophtheirus salmonis]|uniref:uncharacterized protein n=1 Tax=Lepeophtheirus salmonis TaxID=72036 RepID=UPI003AF3801D
MWVKYLLLLSYISTAVKAQLLDMMMGNECLQKQVPLGYCAVLYDDDGCEGWEKAIPVGYTELGWSHRNDAEAVVLRKGCIFTGYDHSGTTAKDRGKSFSMDARSHHKSYHMYKNLDRKSLVDRISSVMCTCPGLDPSGQQRRIDPNSNIKESKCPPMLDSVCAVLYDEEDCVSDDFDPIYLSNGEERSFSSLISLSNIKYKNDIESFTVREGCTLEAFDDSDFSDDGISAVAARGDLLVNLDDHKNDKFEDLDNDIESVKCHC